jgi:hypothetical protein
MKNTLIKIICIANIAVLGLTGCGNNGDKLSISSSSPSSAETKKYEITQFFGSDDDIDAYIQDMKNEDYCEAITTTENHKHILVTATEEQRKKWISKAEAVIKDTIQEIDPDNHYAITCEKNDTKMIISATKDWNTQQLALDMSLVLYNMEIVQIFSGTSSWSVDFIVQNMDNQKILYEVNYPEKEIDFGDSLWENAE